jgi:excisionase family DNA binding protein
VSRPAVQRVDAAVLLTPGAARVLVELVNRYAQTLRTRGARFTPGVAALLAQLEEVTADAGTDANARTPVGQHHWQALSAHDLLSTMEAAALLGCSAGNVRDLARRGALPAHRSGGRWLLERDAVELRAG